MYIQYHLLIPVGDDLTKAPSTFDIYLSYHILILFLCICIGEAFVISPEISAVALVK